MDSRWPTTITIGNATPSRFTPGSGRTATANSRHLQISQSFSSRAMFPMHTPIFWPGADAHQEYYFNTQKFGGV
jgi:hypothetical protein